MPRSIQLTLGQAVGVTSWVSWVVNLLIVEWWLHRRQNFGEAAVKLGVSRAPTAITTRGNPPETRAGVRGLGEAGVLEELARAHIGHGEVDLLAPVVHGVALDRWRTL